MWTGRNNIVHLCQCCFDLYLSSLRKMIGNVCNGHSLSTVGCPLLGRGGVYLLLTSWCRSKAHFLLLLPRRCRVGWLLSLACWVPSPWNLNLERLLNAGTISSGSRVTKITKISFLDSASCTHTPLLIQTSLVFTFVHFAPIPLTTFCLLCA